MTCNLAIAKPVCRWVCWAVLILAVLAVVAGIYLAWRLTTDRAESFKDPSMQFRYGSTGGDKNFGIPYAIWEVLPLMFPEYLPKGREKEGWAAFGFIYEDEAALPEKLAHRRPIGTTLRNYMGVERIFLNCAICHAGTVRKSVKDELQVYLGMPANRIDLQRFQDFIVNAALDERFTPEQILAEIDNRGIELDWFNKIALRLLGIYQVRERTLLIADRFKFAHREPAFGPGRFDTFSPAKALFNWPQSGIPDAEAVGVVDFPSIWLQDKRRGMQLHWDGNNSKLEERNRSAAFGTGALPPILDRTSIRRIEDWLLTLPPPSFAEKFPGEIDKSQLARGQEIYQRNCASCHGRSGTDFSGEYVGKVTPIYEIGTDRYRLDNYTQDLALNQNMLYADHGDERFQNFVKTDGYANMPLDGLWLRTPYLHNGSVPTLWDLLSPPPLRPKAFYRGYDVYDPKNVGFESRPSAIPVDEQRNLFCYQVENGATCGDRPPAQNVEACKAGPCPGNGNGGHLYGTTLTEADKRALIEYLKTF